MIFKEKNLEKIKNKKQIENNLSPIDQWMGLNQILNLHKKINVGLMGLCTLLIVIMISQMFKNPIVAIINEDERVFLKAKREALNVGEKEIKKIIKKFVKKRYDWNKLDPDLITERLLPLMTKGLRLRMKLVLEKLKNEDLQKKEVSQKITDVTVTITKKAVLAHFDKVLRVEGIPLVVPTGVSFQVVRGPQTQWNPYGVYINGIIENTNK